MLGDGCLPDQTRSVLVDRSRALLWTSVADSVAADQQVADQSQAMKIEFLIGRLLRRFDK